MGAILDATAEIRISIKTDGNPQNPQSNKKNVVNF